MHRTYIELRHYVTFYLAMQIALCHLYLIFYQVHGVEYPNCIRKITRVPVDFFHLGDELNVRIING